ncbi:hypothetical protein ACFGW3_05960 [Pasteurella multocida]|uniref:hypothetical protein n=1 Tax=Pasteurella multocida TaxID=747 RepID=UPI002C4CAE7C|nr:hypothetical protein [Pasteurella multocida]MEB3504333.1 hypothetical protein [Pasteurella multocida]
MARPVSFISNKINELHQQAQHYHHAYKDAKKKIKVLEQALFILNPLNDNYFLDSEERIIPKTEYALMREKYQFRKGLAKIIKQLPHQWFSTEEITLKFMELEHVLYDKAIYSTLRKKIAASLRLLHEEGILDRKTHYENGMYGRFQSQWRLTNLSTSNELAN